MMWVFPGRGRPIQDLMCSSDMQAPALLDDSDLEGQAGAEALCS